MGSPYQQLAANGYYVVDAHHDIELISDASQVLSGWFSNTSQQQKGEAASLPEDLANGAGRGYFALPAKEVIEVKDSWNVKDVHAHLRLAARTAYSLLHQTALNTVNSTLSTANGFKVTPQQVQELLGQQQAGGNKRSSSSILHINNYRPADTTAAAASSSWDQLQGCEAHVDKGVLTVIYSTKPGLQVMSRDGCWVPVTPGPGQLVILVGHTLSYMTAGRLPAALHRVVVQQPAAAAGSSNNSRLSLCLKLHADPGALLSPAKITGMNADLLPERYRCPKTTQLLMAEFDATHVSIHSQANQRIQQQQQQQPEAMLAAAEVAAAGPSAATAVAAPVTAACSVTKRPGSGFSPYHLRKRPYLQCDAAGDAAALQQENEPIYLNITVRNQMGVDVVFKVKPTTMLGKVLDVYNLKMGLTEGYRFLFDGVRLGGQCTPATIGLEDGDIIDAIKDNLGD